MNKAYEFLCSKDSRKVQGPDPYNIVLILKAQSILFKRHKEGTIHLNLIKTCSIHSFVHLTYSQSHSPVSELSFF